jgi:hypothetical protein
MPTVKKPLVQCIFKNYVFFFLFMCVLLGIEPRALLGRHYHLSYTPTLSFCFVLCLSQELPITQYPHHCNFLKLEILLPPPT